MDSVHSFGSLTDRAPREGAPCATLSMLTYYRTSRSSHFPFWALCSLSGSQQEIWSVSWNPPVEKDSLSVVCVPLIPTFRRSSQAEGERAPGSSGPVHHGPAYGPTLSLSPSLHGTQTPLPDDPTRLLPVDPHSLGLGFSGAVDPLGARGSTPPQGLPPPCVPRD